MELSSIYWFTGKMRAIFLSHSHYTNIDLKDSLVKSSLYQRRSLLNRFIYIKIQKWPFVTLVWSMTYLHKCQINSTPGHDWGIKCVWNDFKLNSRDSTCPRIFSLAFRLLPCQAEIGWMVEISVVILDVNSGNCQNKIQNSQRSTFS